MSRFDMSIQIRNNIALPRELNCPVRVTVMLKAPVPDDTLQELDELVQGIFRMADLGAYVCEQSLPADARFKLIDRQRQATGFVWECDARAVDRRFSQVFRNSMVMFNQLHHQVESLEMRAMTTPAPEGGPLPELGERSMAETYPPQSTHLQFRIDHELPDDSRNGARVEIGFVQPLGDEALEQILEWLELWATVSLGAYAETEEDAKTGECAIFDASPDITDDYTIEMPIEKFGAVEEAWNSLLNLCERISKEVARIATVIIEQ